MNFKIRFLTVPFCSLLLAAAACSSGPSTNGGGAAATSPNGGHATTSAGIISASDKPLDVMTRATRAQLDAKSYRANITNSLTSGATNTIVIEFVAPDRYHMSTHSQMNGRDTTLEYVIVGKDTFMRMNGGAWRRFP